MQTSKKILIVAACAAIIAVTTVLVVVFNRSCPPHPGTAVTAEATAEAK